MYIVAMDGPSGAGKGTVASYLARRFRWQHIDSGLLYRWIGWRYSNACPNFAKDLATQDTLSVDEALVRTLLRALQDLSLLELQEIATHLRCERTALCASHLGTLQPCRHAVTQWLHKKVMQCQKEQDHSTEMPGVIVDGRDIITHVFPHAQAKIYVTANSEVRYKRRFQENPEASFQHTAHIMHTRDTQDQRHAPVVLEDSKTGQPHTERLTPYLSGPRDIYVLDTTHLSIDEACHNAAEYVTKSCMSFVK